MAKFIVRLLVLVLSGTSALNAQFLCENTPALLTLQTGAWAMEIDIQIYDEDSNLVFNSDDEINGLFLQDYTFYTFELCLEDGCYSLWMMDSFGDGWGGATLTLSYGNTIIDLGTLDYGNFELNGFGINAEGCETIYPGCIDPLALNYNPYANEDDGSCLYPLVCEEGVPADIYVVGGETGAEIGVEISDENGNIVFSLEGLNDWGYEYNNICLDSAQCYTLIMSNLEGNNGWHSGYVWISMLGWQVAYDWLDDNQNSETITFSLNHSCPIQGCTDPGALNYDPNANEDDGSCTYPENCEDNTVIATINTGYWSYEMGWELLNENGDVAWSGGEYFNNFWQYSDYTCLADGCYTLVLYDSFGDGWNNGTITLTSNGQVLYSGGLLFGAVGSASFGLNVGECNPLVVFGCTDPEALNYNPEATVDDGSCIEVVYGCTDPEADNYNYWANTDDGSCIYPEPCFGTEVTLYICTFSFGNEVGLQILDGQGNEIINVNGLGNVQVEYIDLCLPDSSGCFTVNMYNTAGNTGWYSGYFWINYGGIQLINESLDDNLSEETAYFSLNGGCPAYGCTDPEALNFDPEANEDDGSCVYPETCDDNTVLFSFFSGVFPEEAAWSFVDEDGNVLASGSGAGLNWNQYITFAYCLPDGCYSLILTDSFGDGWNGGGYAISINGQIIAQGGLEYGDTQTDLVGINSECGNEETYFGCTDPEALNYDPMAVVDDGSCQYLNEECDYNPVILLLNTQTWGYEISWELADSAGVVIASGDGYNSWSSYAIELCLPDGCYEFHMNDSWGDGWNGAYYMFLGEGQLYGEGTLLYGDYTMDLISVNGYCGVAGCMDPEALNYNPNATVEDGSCLYNGGFGGIFDEFVNPELDFDFDFYPNPFEFEVQIVLNDLNPAKDVVLEVFDGLGRHVLALNCGSDQTHVRRTLDLSDLENGMYLIRIMNGDKTITERIIKQ